MSPDAGKSDARTQGIPGVADADAPSGPCDSCLLGSGIARNSANRATHRFRGVTQTMMMYIEQYWWAFLAAAAFVFFAWRFFRKAGAS